MLFLFIIHQFASQSTSPYSPYFIFSLFHSCYSHPSLLTPPTTAFPCHLQDLELPGVLVFVVQTVSGIEIELPGSLVLVV